MRSGGRGGGGGEKPCSKKGKFRCTTRKDYNIENCGYDRGHNGTMKWSQVHVLDRDPSARTEVLNAVFLCCSLRSLSLFLPG